MRLTEVKKFAAAQGVPALLLRKPAETVVVTKAEKYLEQFKDMLLSRGSIFIAVDNIVQGSQIGVMFLLRAFEYDILDARYLTAEELAQMFADSWEASEAYSEAAEAPFVVLDKIIVAQLDAFRKKTLVRFIEERLVHLRSTIFVADARPGFLPKTTQDFMEAAGCKILSDLGK